MREVKCGCCGQTTLEPDLPAVRTTKEERKAFERWWNQRWFDHLTPEQQAEELTKYPPGESPYA
jgi:hypothetical protein